jgi:DNA-binding MarR family transcriptional regulator
MQSSSHAFPETAATLGALLRSPYRRLQARLYADLAQKFPEIRAAHSSVFRHIAPDGSRLVDLAEQAELTKQSMAYLVTYLEKHGYVRTGDHPEDGRAVLVSLTVKGRSFVEAALQASTRIEAEAAKRVGAEKIVQLRKLLKQLDDAFDEEA